MPSLSSFRKQFLRYYLKTPTLLLSLDKAILEGVGEMAPMDIQLRKCLLSRGSEHLFAEVLEFAALSIVSKCGPQHSFSFPGSQLSLPTKSSSRWYQMGWRTCLGERSLGWGTSGSAETGPEEELRYYAGNDHLTPYF